MIKSIPNLCSFLQLRKAEIVAVTDSIGKHYSTKIQPKKKYGKFQIDQDGSIRMRNLLAPDYFLKSRQKLIANLLNRIVLPDYMYGAISKRNNIMNAGCHVGHTFFLKIDLKDFFPNITHQQIFQMFRENDFSPSVAHLLTKFTSHKYSLPQGAPSSPVISNLVFRKTGNKIAALAKEKNITFTTFLDDLCFSANEPFDEIIPIIIKILKKDHFCPSYKKIKRAINYCEITGLYTYANMLELPYQMQNEAKHNKFLIAYKNAVERYNKFFFIEPL